MKPNTVNSAQPDPSFAAAHADSRLVDEGIEYNIPQHGIVFGRRAGDLPAVDVPAFMLPSLTAAAQHYMEYVKDEDVVIVAPELQPRAAVDEAIELKPLAPAIEHALDRLMGDIGTVRRLATDLASRLERACLPGEVERIGGKRVADRVRSGTSAYVVAIDNAGERVVDVAHKLATILAVLEV